MSEKKVFFEVLKSEKPYLESPLNLYEKLINFLKECEDISKKDDVIEEVLKKFSRIFEIPFEFVSFLNETIKRSDKDFIENPKNFWEISSFKEFSSEEEVKRAFFFLSLPFFRLLSKKKKERGTHNLKGRCSICGEPFSLSVIDEENRRHMICTICGYEEEYFRIGCSYCLHRDCEKIDLLVDEDEVRVELCNDCKSYIKSVKKNSEVYLKYQDPYLIDIVSLPLDVVAQKRGFVRRSPNILGIREVK